MTSISDIMAKLKATPIPFSVGSSDLGDIDLIYNFMKERNIKFDFLLQYEDDFGCKEIDWDSYETFCDMATRKTGGRVMGYYFTEELATEDLMLLKLSTTNLDI